MPLGSGTLCAGFEVTAAQKFGGVDAADALDECCDATSPRSLPLIPMSTLSTFSGGQAADKRRRTYSLIDHPAMSTFWTSLLGDVIALASERGVHALFTGKLAIATDSYTKSAGVPLTKREGKWWRVRDMSVECGGAGAGAGDGSNDDDVQQQQLRRDGTMKSADGLARRQTAGKREDRTKVHERGDLGKSKSRLGSNSYDCNGDKTERWSGTSYFSFDSDRILERVRGEDAETSLLPQGCRASKDLSERFRGGDETSFGGGGGGRRSGGGRSEAKVESEEAKAPRSLLNSSARVRRSTAQSGSHKSSQYGVRSVRKRRKISTPGNLDPGSHPSQSEASPGSRIHSGLLVSAPHQQGSKLR
ncbi:hypothetical protein C8035_v004694 [Colletotrichum spinosum]|uniref:Uncharacterized protein n=1 Tax=Colletotrichum spinosum TaxID=1347390 RepID=A0A4R8QRI2_9PEZI|nr:hypothetical protein C8035_v004694 [Colletotrichum spinosum]